VLIASPGPSSTNIGEQMKNYTKSEFIMSSDWQWRRRRPPACVRRLASDRMNEEMKHRCVDILGSVLNEHGNTNMYCCYEVGVNEYPREAAAAIILRRLSPPNAYLKRSTRSLLEQHAIRLGDDERSVRTGRTDDIEEEVGKKWGVGVPSVPARL